MKYDEMRDLFLAAGQASWVTRYFEEGMANKDIVIQGPVGELFRNSMHELKKRLEAGGFSDEKLVA
jgi:hypothetical protein